MEKKINNSMHVKIKNRVPAFGTDRLFRRLKKVESRSMHGQMPIVWNRADDFQVYDAHGNCWIDFTSTIFVSNAGHGNSRIRDAVRDVIDKP